MHEFARQLVLGGVLVIALFASACGSEFGDAEAVRAEGLAEIQRHQDSPLVAPLESGRWTPLGDLRVVGRERNDDPGQIFGRIGSSPTEFRRSYALVDDDVEGALDEAVAQLVERGATLDRSIAGARYLSAEHQGDRLTIELLVLEAAAFEMNQRVTIT